MIMAQRFIYVKINPAVSAFLGQTHWRARTADGNYIAFIHDIKRIDRDFLAHPEETASAIGALLLNGAEAKEEQDGASSRPLPAATDPRFYIDPSETGGAEEEDGTVAESPEDGADADSPAQEETDTENEETEGGQE